MSVDQLSGQTALITGAAKRIGREIALALAGLGINIVLHFNRSDDESSGLAAELRKKGVQSWTIQADFRRPDEYQSLIDRTLQAAGRLDILINNASMFPQETLSDLTWQSLSANLEVNAWVPFVLCREFARRVGRGRIVNLLDSRLVSFDWTHVGYILSKHVLGALTRMMALEYAPDITVNGVAPGLILPPPGKDQKYIEERAQTVPLRRHGGPQDIAAAVAFLVGSDFLTGEVIFVDGGRHLYEYDGSNPRQGPRPAVQPGSHG